MVRALFLAAAVLGLVISLAIVLALVEEAVRWLFAIDVGWLWAEDGSRGPTSSTS